MRHPLLPALFLLVACSEARMTPSADAPDGGRASDAGVITPRADAGTFGAERECYGIADDLREVFSINPATGQATHLCTVPAGIAEIDAIASHPITGIYYYVSQGDMELGTTAELGSFTPDTCVFEPIGPIAVADLAGLSFHPETADLYGSDQTSDALYRFGKDAASAPTAETTLVGNLPLHGKAIAIQPETNKMVVSDDSSLLVYDLTTNTVGATQPLSVQGVQALFFLKTGELFGTTDGSAVTLPNHFVQVNMAGGAVTDVGGFNPVLYLPGTTARPIADDLEAMDCNVGGACGDCID